MKHIIFQVLSFGGIIGRDNVAKSMEEAIQAVRREGIAAMADNLSRRSTSSLESTSSKINNFTFGAYYEDSE